MSEESDLKHISLAIVKNDQDEVLIVKRLNPERGKDGVRLGWAFPGGTVDSGETEEETAVREAFEETGHQVAIISKLSKREHPQYPVTVPYYACDVISTATSLLIDIHEIEQARWVHVSRIRDYLTTDIDPHVLKFLDN